MAFPLSKNLINQLPKAVEEFVGEWCELNCEIYNGGYLKINGKLEIKNTKIRLIGKYDFINEITYDQIADFPIIIINVGRYDEEQFRLVNLQLVSNLSGLFISNNWEPPREVKFPNKRNVDFNVMSEMQVIDVSQKFHDNSGAAVTIFLKYFDEDIHILNDYLNNHKIGHPNTNDIVLNGKIINGREVITDQNETITIFYNQALGSGMILGLGLKDEIAFANLIYEIKK